MVRLAVSSQTGLCRRYARRALKLVLGLVCAAMLLLIRAGKVVEAAENGSDWLKDKSSGDLANELMAAVNELRAAQGLNTLNAHPILVQLAQAQASYMASIGATTHLSADGRRPFQRALAAGYPVAGDLSQGGFYSENIQSGSGLTPQDVVNIWMGDEPHQNTMLSVNRSDMGAGVAVSDGFLYFVLDTALASSAPVENLLATIGGPTEIAAFLAPVVANTPGPDGAILHTVREGETLWTIAAAYGLTVEQLTRINLLNPGYFIFPGERLVIQAGVTPTPSPRPTRTPRVRHSPTPAATPDGAGGAQSLPTNSTFLLVVLLVGIALAAVISLLWPEARRGKPPE